MSGIVANRNDASSLLEVLQNSELLEKRLTQLRDAEARAKEVIDLAGPASEITQIREQLREDEANRVKLISDAEAEAKSILEKAKEAADQKLAAASEEAKQIEAKASSKLADAEVRFQEAKEEASKSVQLNRDLEEAEKKAAIREEQFNARLLELEEERNILADERKKLAGVRDQIASMLE